MSKNMLASQITALKLRYYRALQSQAYNGNDYDEELAKIEEELRIIGIALKPRLRRVKSDSGLQDDNDKIQNSSACMSVCSSQNNLLADSSEEAICAVPAVHEVMEALAKLESAPTQSYVQKLTKSVEDVYYKNTHGHFTTTKVATKTKERKQNAYQTKSVEEKDYAGRTSKNKAENKSGELRNSSIKEVDVEDYLRKSIEEIHFTDDLISESVEEEKAIKQEMKNVETKLQKKEDKKRKPVTSKTSSVLPAKDDISKTKSLQSCESVKSDQLKSKRTFSIEKSSLLKPRHSGKNLLATSTTKLRRKLKKKTSAHSEDDEEIEDLNDERILAQQRALVITFDEQPQRKPRSLCFDYPDYDLSHGDVKKAIERIMPDAFTNKRVVSMQFENRRVKHQIRDLLNRWHVEVCDSDTRNALLNKKLNFSTDQREISVKLRSFDTVTADEYKRYLISISAGDLLKKFILENPGACEIKLP